MLRLCYCDAHFGVWFCICQTLSILFAFAFGGSTMFSSNGEFPRDKILVMDCKKLQDKLKQSQKKRRYAMAQFEDTVAHTKRAIMKAADDALTRCEEEVQPLVLSRRDELLEELRTQADGSWAALRDSSARLDAWLENAEMVREATEWAIVSEDAGQGDPRQTAMAAEALAKVMSEAGAGGASFEFREEDKAVDVDVAAFVSWLSRLKPKAPDAVFGNVGQLCAGVVPAFGNGNALGNLNKPTSVAEDAEGNSIVCDSRNYSLAIRRGSERHFTWLLGQQAQRGPNYLAPGSFGLHLHGHQQADGGHRRGR